VRPLRCSVAALYLAGLAAIGAASQPAPAEVNLRPIFAVWQDDPGSGLLADAPRAVIYDDGTVISQRLPAGQLQKDAAPAGPVFLIRKLAAAEIGVWYDDILTIVQNEELSTTYTLDRHPGAPVVYFHFQAGPRAVTVSVRGLRPEALSPFGVPLNPDAEEIPARLLRLYQDVGRLDMARSTEWKPAIVEVRFRPVAEAVRQAAPWPSGWPGGDVISGTRDGDLHPLALEGAVLPNLHRLLFSSVPPGVVSSGGESVSAAYRVVFPGEQVWRDLREVRGDAMRYASAAEDELRLSGERERLRGSLRDQLGREAGLPPVPPLPSTPAPVRVPLPDFGRNPAASPLPGSAGATANASGK
jgi:hypothetical protein